MESPFEALNSYIARSQERRAEIQNIIDQRRINSIAQKPLPIGKPPKSTGQGSAQYKGGGGSVGKNVPKHGKIGFSELMDRIGEKESGGSYSATGQWNNLSYGRDRAYGKYQIMGNNIPSWTKTYLGHSLTPQQFLNRPKAQERVAAGKMKYYYKRYGPGGAAAAWYGGESAAQAWRKYRSSNYSADGTEYPSIFEYVKDILRG